MKKLPKKLALAFACVSLLTLAACRNENSTITNSSSVELVRQATSEVEVSDNSENISLSDSEATTISSGGTYTLTGSTSKGLVITSDDNVKIQLSNADISNTDGAAISVEGSGSVIIEVVDGTENKLADSSTRSDDSIEGTIYSSSDLYITGNGSLTVEANYADGIVSKDGLTLEGGNITITSEDDAIRGKDYVVVTGGQYTIDSQGDAVKSNNDEDESLGYIHVQAGDFTINSGSDGFQAETDLTIDGGTINIENSVEGLEAPHITINGGIISIYATDDGINASAGTLITSGMYINITGGDLSIEMGQGDTDAIDSNGDLNISGGNIDITAQFAFDFDGSSSFTGGTITVNGEEVTEAENSMMMGGGGHGAMMSGGPSGRMP